MEIEFFEALNTTSSLARIPQISFSLVFFFHTIISLVNTSFIERVPSANGNIPRKEGKKIENPFAPIF